MDAFKLDDTVDFSALDVLSSSSTPRLLAQDRTMKSQNNDQNNDNKAPVQRPEDVASEYSIHLSALGAHSASSTLNLEREVIKIDSDDMGGPSDFTLNMAEWMNGDRQLKSDELDKPVAMQHYRQPSVEESNTPMPVRSKQVPVSKPEDGDLLKSSQCLTTPPQKPQDDLYAQLAALQAKCARLQQSNDELSQMLDSFRASSDREATLKTQLDREQRLRTDERLAADKAQQTSDRELQRAEERSRALQDALNDERATAARTQVDVELVQQNLHAQIATWKQHTIQARRKCAELEVVQSAPQHADVERVTALESQLTELKISHKKEVADLKEEYDGVAKDVDDWVVAKLKEKDELHATVDTKRKAEVARLKLRNKDLERLYSMCGKELMLSWGREEFGAPIGGKQKYRYQS